jgi:hypothetical protein
MSDISPFIVESLRGMFAGVLPAFWVLNAGCVWLVKLRMLLFALAFLLSVFALFIAPIGRPVGFNFLFFDASSASSVLCDAPGGASAGYYPRIFEFCAQAIILGEGGKFNQFILDSMRNVTNHESAQMESVLRAWKNFLTEPKHEGVYRSSTVP